MSLTIILAVYAILLIPVTLLARKRGRSVPVWLSLSLLLSPLLSLFVLLMLPKTEKKQLKDIRKAQHQDK
ncbi:hypothetical protein EOPP23_06220 [Endozoicomonas sp. OPT23]|nr:hypothetical protein [Endozoicomonas sp. OPT23]